MRRFYRRESGSILVFVLWIVIFLSVTAVTLGEQAQLGAALVVGRVQRVKAHASAWAGIISALDELRGDPSALEKMSFEERKAFHHGELKDGRFDIFYKQEGQTRDGIQEEEAKINLNALTAQTSQVLFQLIQLLGFDEEHSRVVAASVVDWRDDDHDPPGSGYGAEDDFYSRLAKPYRCKNAAFDSLEELMLVRGVSRELYEKMKDYATIYPKSASRLGINFQTAPAVVIQALGRSFIGDYGRLTVDDADQLAGKIIDFRRGDDGKDKTGDDRKLDAALLGLTTSQEVLFQKMLPFKADQSNYFSIHSRGVYKTAAVNLEAVIRRQDLSILAWRMTDE